MDNIVSHSLLTIVAGSDTTSTTLSAALCFLLSDRKVYDRLREELDSAFPDTTVSTIDGWPDIQIDQLAKLEYLNAVMCVYLAGRQDVWRTHDDAQQRDTPARSCEPHLPSKSA